VEKAGHVELTKKAKVKKVKVKKVKVQKVKVKVKVTR
jgi:hypothetical protein